MAAIPPLRPPGAIEEREFLRRCIQCGRCAQVCQFKSIVLTAGCDPFLAGTPRVEPWRIPCWLCMRCVSACPAVALRPVPMERAGMGMAFLDKERCYTYEGSIICKTCHEKCPLRNSALVMEAGLFPVITEACVGCGVCENVCPRKAIVTVPRSRMPGRAGRGSQASPAGDGGDA